MTNDKIKKALANLIAVVKQEAMVEKNGYLYPRDGCEYNEDVEDSGYLCKKCKTYSVVQLFCESKVGTPWDIESDWYEVFICNNCGDVTHCENWG